MHQCDVKAVFLHSPIEEEVYLEQSQEFVKQGSDGEKAETEGHIFILVWVDDIILALRSMTVISDLKKALEATFDMENRGRIHSFLGLRTRREEGKVTVDQERHIESMLETGSMQTLKNSNCFKFETSDSTERIRRGGPEELQKLCWITSVSIWSNRRGQISCSQSTFCPDI